MHLSSIRPPLANETRPQQLPEGVTDHVKLRWSEAAKQVLYVPLRDGSGRHRRVLAGLQDNHRVSGIHSLGTDDAYDILSPA
mmetsp:Transcript_12396/g.26737  ORF Transcript_12396/g.26737 Transcript_12396/m.26737 type:complete len:82 (+) Transcript_12396:1268-1513(+)